MFSMLAFFSSPRAVPLVEPEGTNAFYTWYFYGLGGIGGWVIFLLFALVAMIWLLYDSNNRQIRAVGWKIGVMILAGLLIPTMLYRFTVTSDAYTTYSILKAFGVETLIRQFPQYAALTYEMILGTLPPMTPYDEQVFYLGLLGGILAPVAAVGYYITFQGMIGCPNGHVYEAILGRCPQCTPPTPPIVDRFPISQGGGVQVERKKEYVTPPPPQRPAIQYAWLIDTRTQRRYDLFQNTTRVGRASECDIVLTDPSVSRAHAQIRESHGHCTLSDLDSKTGTLLNQKKIRTPMVLQNGDRITLGDTVLQFVSTRI